MSGTNDYDPPSADLAFPGTIRVVNRGDEKVSVHATRHNIQMYPYFLFAAIHHPNRPRLSLSDLVAHSAE